jgi:superfamily II DNA or RNA helicase
MRFKELNLDETYDTVKNDDIYSEFFIPVLDKSRKAIRFGGTFSSENFVRIAQGMKGFIEKDGVMKLIVYPNISDEDFQAIMDGKKSEPDVILEKWIEDIEQISEKFVKEHVKALAWMIKNDILEIKLIRIKDSSGREIPFSKISDIARAQEMYGVFFGSDDDEIVSFVGNLDYVVQDTDFTHITAYKYWETGQKQYIDEKYSEWDDLWEGKQIEFLKDYFFETFDISKEIREKFIKIAPNSKDEINLERPFSLRPYQKKALVKWEKNDFKGIFEMATGTGKTRVAIGAIKRMEKINDTFLIVISVPSDTLAVQWKVQLEQWGYETFLTLKNNHWEEQMPYHIQKSDKRKKILCIITSYITFSKKKFKEKIFDYKKDVFLISDEVHNAGAPEFSKGLDESLYKHRLGLTATLERYFDDEGTKILDKFFHSTVFEYSLKDGISDKILSPYRYHVIPVILNEVEMEKYRKETKTMAIKYEQRSDPVQWISFLHHSNKRAKIVKNASQKFSELKKVFQSRHDNHFGLIYCDSEQIKEVTKICNNTKPHPIYVRRITLKDTPTREDREKITNGLVNGDYHAVSSILILNEGWDCPELKYCILMSNTGNEKEYIQRRGRVLRKFNGDYFDGSKKEFAEIYDFCVIPDLTGLDKVESKMEKNLTKKEFLRLKIIAKASLEPEKSQVLDMIQKFEEKFS